LLGTVAVATLLIPGAADAQSPGGNPISRQPRAQVSEQLALKGTNGYQVAVEVVDGRNLTLVALKAKGLDIEAAEYRLRLRREPGPDEIVAQLGQLGRIDVHFVPGKTKKSKPPRGCSGGKTVTEEGHFVGFISFQGEQGYTQVDADHAQGAVITEPPRACSHPVQPGQQRRQDRLKAGSSKAAEDEKGGEVETVTLRATTADPAVSLKASRVSGTEKNGTKIALASFLVTAKRRLGPIKEQSVLTVLFAGGATFLSPEPLEPTSELILEPPAPFTGSSTYRQETPTRADWSGNLKVALPGFGTVPLAGRSSEATATLHRDKS
jgi:hypothetical protein